MDITMTVVRLGLYYARKKYRVDTNDQLWQKLRDESRNTGEQIEMRQFESKSLSI
jgi:hypothetical protein